MYSACILYLFTYTYMNTRSIGTGWEQSFLACRERAGDGEFGPVGSRLAGSQASQKSVRGWRMFTRSWTTISWVEGS